MIAPPATSPKERFTPRFAPPFSREAQPSATQPGGMLNRLTPVDDCVASKRPDQEKGMVFEQHALAVLSDELREE